MEWIKLSLPHKAGNEMKYIEKAYRDDWFVPLGPDVDEFERRLTAFEGGRRPVVALSAGTAALHLGLVMLGVGKGDEVICQSLTFSASCNPVLYQGATPVFVDSEKPTWNMDPGLLEEAINDRIAKTGRKPKAIVAVDLYGMPADFSRICEIARRYDIPLLEDAAEGMGSNYKGERCGNFGEYGALSFNGNKIITTSGGGALICPDDEAAARVKFLATQARENRPYYYHTVVGYNYRLSNISAAIGCAQIEQIEERLARRRRIHSLYAEAFAETPVLHIHDNPTADYDSNFWLTTALLDDSCGLTPDELRLALLDRKIETRLLWRPMHMQPLYAEAPYYGTGISDRLFDRGICLPSGSSLDDGSIERVVDAIREIIIAH